MLVAREGRRLTALAHVCGRTLRYSAAVGGSMPLLERLASAAGRHVRSVRAALGAASNGTRLQHVAALHFSGSRPRASVRLTELEPDDPLAAVAGERNRAVVEWADGTRDARYGRAAGRWPTAEAVVADLLDLARARASRESAETDTMPEVGELAAMHRLA